MDTARTGTRSVSNGRRLSIIGVGLATVAAIAAGLAGGAGAHTGPPPSSPCGGGYDGYVGYSGYSGGCPTPTPTTTATPASTTTGPPATATPTPTRQAVDRTGPVLHVRVLAHQRLRTVVKRGLRLAIACSEPCALDVRAFVDRRTARRLGIDRRARGNVTLGSVRAPLGPLARVIAVRFSSKAKTALRHARRLALGVRAAATDAAGNTTALARLPVSLKR